MQKFILIRGHQGSGKSTFALTKIAEFKAKYPNALIVHLENDLLLIDSEGNYRWSPKAVDMAQRKNLATFKNTLKQGQQQPALDILIVNSNTNQKASGCRQLLRSAEKQGFETEVYRLHNFFDNQHNVNQAGVVSAYVKLNQNPLVEEIHVPAIQPISVELQTLVERKQAFNLKDLPFDEQQQTYVTADYLTFADQNFTRKQSRRYPQLSVLKYARHIFYDNRFDNALLEMRGLVLDEYNQIIIRPFKKVFNYSERIARNSPYPIRVSDERLVDAVVKVNGFLGVCTYIDLAETHPGYQADFNHKILYSTTGSLDSQYAEMVEKHCEKYTALFKQYPNHSFLFEITDPSDPHIIQEDFGETLIGCVEVKTGQQFAEQKLDQLGEKYQIKRPEILKNIAFGELKALLKNVKHEGFMVFAATEHGQQGEMLFKLKSPYYLVSKLLGRSTADNLNAKLNKRHLDEEYYPLIDHIKAHQEQFNQLDEQAKIAFIQAFLGKI